ncbi:MAG: hypothetical protein PHV74_02330 [Dehalococcoidia bacterium]|nr:hypothetical protein [Dehalococcoidia bacterium]
MIKKKVFGIGLGLVMVVGAATGAVALADGSQKNHLGPVEINGVTIEESGADDIQEVGVTQLPADSIVWDSQVNAESEPLESPATSGCICTFSVVDGEVSALSSEDEAVTVTVVSSAAGDVKTGQIRVQFPDNCICPCMSPEPTVTPYGDRIYSCGLSDGQRAFSILEATPEPCPTATPYPEATPSRAGAD